MLKVFFLIFEPAVAWEKISNAKRGCLFILVTHLLPFIVLATAAEGWGMMRWGKWQPQFGKIKEFTPVMVWHFEVLQAVMFLLVVFLCALLLLLASEQFHGKRTFLQSFTVIAYGFSPILLLHPLNMMPTVHPAVSWIIGVTLTIFVIYAGVPRVLQPLPVHAFGTYCSAIFIVLLVSGLMRVFTGMYLLGQINFQRSAFTRALGQWLMP
jgi:hypothetical protein